MKRHERDQLAKYLRAKLAEGGAFKVVPPDQIKEAIVANKKTSLKACYDRACQIELGKEVAAQKSLGTEIIRIGKQCAVTGTLYDLSCERAATHRSGCNVDELVAGVEVIVSKLGGQKFASSAESVGALRLGKIAERMI